MTTSALDRSRIAPGTGINGGSAVVDRRTNRARARATRGSVPSAGRSAARGTACGDDLKARPAPSDVNHLLIGGSVCGIAGSRATPVSVMRAARSVGARARGQALRRSVRAPRSPGPGVRASARGRPADFAGQHQGRGQRSGDRGARVQHLVLAPPADHRVVGVRSVVFSDPRCGALVVGVPGKVRHQKLTVW